MAKFGGNSQNLYVSAEVTGAQFFEFSSTFSTRKGEMTNQNWLSPGVGWSVG